MTRDDLCAACIGEVGDLLARREVSPVELTQAVLPDLIPGGSVIFVTSKAGHVGMYDRAAYGASKAATEAMMRLNQVVAALWWETWTIRARPRSGANGLSR